MSEEQLEYLCIKLAEVNAALSTSAVALTTLIDSSPNVLSLVMFSVCGAMLSYDAVLIHNEENTIDNKAKVKRYYNNRKSNP